MTGDDSALIEVRLLGLPVQVLQRSRERFEELTRELALVAAPAGSDRGDADPELAHLAEVLERHADAHIRTAQIDIDAALASGVEHIDAHVKVPASAAQEAAELLEALERADAQCRGGRLLLLAADDDLRRFRRWYLRQHIDQARGAPAVSWFDFTG